MKRIRSSLAILVIFAVLAANGIIKGHAAPASYALLHSFALNGDGRTPQAGLMQGSDGFLYGTTRYGGNHQNGAVFKLSPDGTGYSIIHSFTGDDGNCPFTTLLQGSDGTLYGSTAYGGSSAGVPDSGSGTVFKLGPDGTAYSVIHDFNGGGAEGRAASALVLGREGMLYITTETSPDSGGSVFRLNPDGTDWLVLHEFSPANGDGGVPAGLMQGCDGALYGTTALGGDHDLGTVFRMTIPPLLGSPECLGDHNFRGSLWGITNVSYRIEASTDLQNWVTLTNLSNPAGIVGFCDLTGTNFSRRFYRAVRAP
jgi:uncharacterized repeat protein (TIGR03803 family)